MLRLSVFFLKTLETEIKVLQLSDSLLGDLVTYTRGIIWCFYRITKVCLELGGKLGKERIREAAVWVL